MKILRKTFIAALSVMAFATIGTAVYIMPTTVNAEGEAVIADYALEEGASVRFGNNGNGLRFTFDISATAYENGNEYTKYGVLIAPEDYLTEGKELTLANVFGVGGTAIYNWAVKGEDGTYTYTAEAGKTQIVNIEAESFVDRTVKVDGQDVALKTFYASMINVLDGTYDAEKNPNSVNNLAREFRAVGYVATSSDGATYTYELVEYMMTSEDSVNYTYEALNDEANVRSIAYVAQKAIEDTSSKKPTDIQKQWLTDNYVAKVTDLQAEYTVEHYVEQSDGSFAVKETETKTDKTIADAVTATANTYAGYAYDADNENNVTSGTVYANGKLVLKLYYTYSCTTEDKGLIDVSKTATLDTSSFAAGTTVKLYRTQTNTATASEKEVTATVTDDGLSLSGLNGTYTAKAITSDGVVTNIVTFDAYDSTVGLSWSDITEIDVAVKDFASTGGIESGVVDITETGIADGRTGDYYMVSKADEATTTRPVLTFMPIHSKAYYDLYAEVMSEYTLSYDIYVSAATTQKVDEESITVTALGGTIADDAKWNSTSNAFNGVQVPNGKWTTYSITLDKFYDNWDKYVSSNAYICVYLAANTFYYSGGTTSMGTYTYYVGNLNVSVEMESVEIEEQLVDVKGMETYDLTSLMSDEAKATFNQNLNYGEVVWTLTNSAGVTTTLTGTSTVDFSEVAARYYTLEAKIGETVICTGSVDFYDNSNGLQWTEVEEGSYYLLSLNNAAGDTGSVEIVKDPFTRTGNYYKYIPGDIRGFVNLKASHSKTYYETFASGAQLSMDVYVVVPDGITVLKTGPFGTAVQNGTQIGTWQTYTADITKYVTNFNVESAYYTFMDYNAYLYDGSSWSADYTKKVEIYFGNIQIAIAMDSVTIEEQLVDVKDAETYDLRNLMSDEAKATFNQNLNYGEVVWTLTDMEGEVTTLTDTSTVDFSKVAARYYTLEAKIGATVVCTGSVDFYNSANGVEWGSGYKFSAHNNAATTAECSVVDIATTDIAGDRTGNYYKIDYKGDSKTMTLNLVPIHSKAYYELYRDYRITVDVYFETDNVDAKMPKAGCMGNYYQQAANINGWLTLNNTANTNQTIGTIVNNWDNFLVNHGTYSMFYCMGDMLVSTAWVKTEAFTVYVGNIQFTAP